MLSTSLIDNGVETHEAWAPAGIAPKLLEQHLVAGMWHKVVMEYLPPELPDALVG